VAEEKQMKAKALKVVQRLMNRGLVEGFERWRDTVVAERQMKENARAEEERRAAVMQRVVKRMQHATLASGLLSWREQVRELRRQQGILENVASRMRNAAVYMAFARWGESAKEVHRQRTEEMQKWGGERKPTLQKIVGRMLHRSLWYAMDLWQENVQTSQQEQAESERQTWQREQIQLQLRMDELLMLLQDARQVCQVIVGFFCSIVGLFRLYGRSFDACASRIPQDCEFSRAKEEERRQNILSRIVRRILNQGKSAAFERWSANVHELARQRGIMDRILRRMLHANLAAGETARVLAACHCAPWAFARVC